MNTKERFVLTETRRLWIQTARSKTPGIKFSEPEYEYHNNCPACKYHGCNRIDSCPGNCLLSPLWGSCEEYACECEGVSLYAEWYNLSQYNCFLNPGFEFNSRRARSAAWKLINGIETMLWNDRLASETQHEKGSSI